MWDTNIKSTLAGDNCGAGNRAQEPTSGIVWLRSGKGRDAWEGGPLMIAEYLGSLPRAATPWASAWSPCSSRVVFLCHSVPLRIPIGRLVSSPYLHQLQQRVPQVPPRHEGYVSR